MKNETMFLGVVVGCLLFALINAVPKIMVEHEENTYHKDFQLLLKLVAEGKVDDSMGSNIAIPEDFCSEIKNINGIGKKPYHRDYNDIACVDKHSVFHVIDNIDGKLLVKVVTSNKYSFQNDIQFMIKKKEFVELGKKFKDNYAEEQRERALLRKKTKE